jgi:hypothetical protein
MADQWLPDYPNPAEMQSDMSAIGDIGLLARNGIPWQQWTRSQNVEDQRSPAWLAPIRQRLMQMFADPSAQALMDPRDIPTADAFGRPLSVAGGYNDVDARAEALAAENARRTLLGPLYPRR